VTYRLETGKLLTFLYSDIVMLVCTRRSLQGAGSGKFSSPFVFLFLEAGNGEGIYVKKPISGRNKYDTP
jgi:hypothetical protein